jgi:NADPH:quinone reductase-like Zn-dependent oxidoreductase
VIDYQRVDFTKATRDIDVVLELVGGDYGARSIEVLREGGLLVTVVERTNTKLAAKVIAARRRFAGVTVEPGHIGLESLAALVDDGSLKVHVSHALPLADVAQAQTLFERGATLGKIVVTP